MRNTMLKPYIICEETDASTTYQYNTLYSWTLLGFLALMFIGIMLNNTILQTLSAVLIVFYFGAQFIFGRAVSMTIKRALKSGTVEVSGSKYSFSRPIKIKVPKNA